MSDELVELAEQAAVDVYRGLGSGHSESVYHRAMEVELRLRGIRYESRVMIPVLYRGLTVGYGEADLILFSNEKDYTGLVVELKAVTYAPRAAERSQILCYLRSRGYDNAHGVLINFRQPTASTPTPDQPDIEKIKL